MHRNDEPNQKKALELSAELSQLRREAQNMNDSELVGAADALEKSAREIWTAGA